VTPSPRAAALVLAASVLLSHLPLLFAGYVQDDHIAVEDNAIVASGAVTDIIGAGYWDAARGGDRSLYRPATVGSFALERRIAGGARPGVSHAVNLILHAMVCWMLYAIAVRCGVDPTAAFLAALLFALTPSKSEAVANVVGRSELLAALFTLSAVRCALEEGSRGAAAAAAACVFLAGASKETGMIALPLVALAAWGGRRTLDVAGMIAPSVLAFVVLVVVRTAALQAFFPPQVVPAMDNPLVREHGVRYAATVLALVGRYAGLAVFPFHLANDYSGASIPIENSFLSPWTLAGTAIVMGLAYVATRGRVAALCAAIVVLPYLLVGHVLVPSGSIFAERFLYLPLAGVGLLTAVALPSTGVWGRRLALAAAVVLGVAMFTRALDWKDDATIFSATARHNPRSPKAALWLSRFDEAIANWPESAAAWNGKGLALARAGDLAAAEGALRESVRLQPSRAEFHFNLGLVLHRRNAPAAAEPELRKAVLFDPDDARAWAELGHVRYAAGRTAGAADAYRRAVALGRADLTPRLRELEGR
jgi:protein O-mannosyl-transferase